MAQLASWCVPALQEKHRFNTVPPRAASPATTDGQGHQTSRSISSRMGVPGWGGSKSCTGSWCLSISSRARHSPCHQSPQSWHWEHQLLVYLISPGGAAQPCGQHLLPKKPLSWEKRLRGTLQRYKILQTSARRHKSSPREGSSLSWPHLLLGAQSPVPETVETGSDFRDGSPSSGNPKPAQETPCSHRNMGLQRQSLLATTEEKKPMGVHKPSRCTSLHGCSVQTSPLPSPMPAPSRDLENTFPLVSFNPSFCFASLIDGKGKSAATLPGQPAASQVRATKCISGTRCRLPTERGLSTRQRAGRGPGVRLW